MKNKLIHASLNKVSLATIILLMSCTVHASTSYTETSFLEPMDSGHYKVKMVTKESMEKQNESKLVVKLSAYSVNKTMNRFEKIIKSKGISVFLRLDHAKSAKKVGKKLLPTQLLIFGNPKLGSPLMMENQAIGIDLPLKVIVWKDPKGKVWLGYNKPTYIGNRHGIKTTHPVLTKMTNVLNKLTNSAITK